MNISHYVINSLNTEMVRRMRSTRIVIISETKFFPETIYLNIIIATL